MICYKDRSFCSSSSTCVNRACHRLATQLIKDKARDYGLPIAWAAFKDGSECPGFKPKPSDTDWDHDRGDALDRKVSR